MLSPDYSHQGSVAVQESDLQEILFARLEGQHLCRHSVNDPKKNT
jgi:hypothetical protein